MSIAEGTSIWFDFLLPDGHLRTDYLKQHKDSLQYLDDVVEPLLHSMKCRMVIYADHGNLIYSYDTKLSDVKNTDYFCSDYQIRIPLIIRSPEMEIKTDNQLISLMEIRSIVASLLTETPYNISTTNHIKIVRSTMYNPDFIKLYHMMGKAKYLQPFECFIFTDNIKFIIFADGSSEVYDIEDHPLQNINKNLLFERIGDEITVFEFQAVRALHKQLKSRSEKNLLFLTDSSNYEYIGKTSEMSAVFRKAGYNTLVLDINKKQFLQQANILYQVSKELKFQAVVCCNPDVITDLRLLECGEKIFILLQDSPVAYDKQLKNLNNNASVYCTDTNYAKYIQQYYPNIGKSAFTFQPGCYLEEQIAYPKRSIDVLLAYDYIEPEKIFAKIQQKYTKEIYSLVEQLILKLIASPDKTYENALKEIFEDFSLNDITNEQFKNFAIEFQIANQYRQAYYNNLIVRQLLQYGIKLHILGEGWENFKTPNSIYISVEHWNWYTFQKALSNAKITLIVAPNEQNMLNDRIIAGLMSGSVIAANYNQYLQHNFKDMKNIVLYNLNNLEALPKKLKFLLENNTFASEIAQNGKVYAKKYYTWENSVKYMLEELQENGLYGHLTKIPGKELVIRFQQKQREEVALDVFEEFSRIDEIISALQTCTTICRADYQYCIEHLTKAMQIFAIDFPDSDNTKQLENMITQLKLKYEFFPE